MNLTTPGMQIPYIVKYTWTFDLSLNMSLNNFTTDPVVADVGDLLLYSFNTSGGRIGIDAVAGFYPDYNVSNKILVGPLSGSPFRRFSIFIQTAPSQKGGEWPATFYKYYDTPGTYKLKMYLQGKYLEVLSMQ